MSGEGPVTVAYYYRTRWGAHDEFVALFDRNHLLTACLYGHEPAGAGRAEWGRRQRASRS